MTEIEMYAAAFGIQPTTVVQRAGAVSGKAWSNWLSGGSCSMRVADRIRKYMADNPPALKQDGEAA